MTKVNLIPVNSKFNFSFIRYLSRSMDLDAVLTVIRDSLYAVTAARLFDTERGYQGALLAELSRRFLRFKVLSDDALVEQEHQKRLRDHGLKIRPDLIIHEPFDPKRHASRTEGNLAVFELKRRATKRAAREDFGNLISMMRILCYPLGVFVNIDATETHHSQAPKRAPGRLVAFAVSLDNGCVRLIEQGT